MKMGSDCIICLRICFYGRVTVKSGNWRALITVGLPSRTRALVGGWRWKWNEERSAAGWVSRRELGWTVKKDEEKARGPRGTGRVLRGLGRVKRVDVAAGRRCVIYFPSLPRRGRTLNRRGVPRALHAPMNQSYTTTTVFHPRTTLGKTAKILRKSQPAINHASYLVQQVERSQIWKLVFSSHFHY